MVNLHIFESKQIFKGVQLDKCGKLFEKFYKILHSDTYLKIIYIQWQMSCIYIQSSAYTVLTSQL